MNKSPFVNRLSYQEESSSSTSTQHVSQQQRPMSMYDTSTSQSMMEHHQSHSMQKSHHQTFQSQHTIQHQHYQQQLNTIPSTYSLQPLGGRADLTVRQLDSDDSDSSSPDSVSSSFNIIKTYSLL